MPDGIGRQSSCEVSRPAGIAMIDAICARRSATRRQSGSQEAHGILTSPVTSSHTTSRERGAHPIDAPASVPFIISLEAGITTRLQPRRSIATIIPLLGTVLVLACGGDDTIAPPNSDAAQVAANGSISQRFSHTLLEAGFTGRVGQSLTARLGRPINPRIAEVGRMLWFDSFTGLNDDNSCGGCHSPTNGMGDVGSIAIGIDNNGVVGPGRATSGAPRWRSTPRSIRR